MKHFLLIFYCSLNLIFMQTCVESTPMMGKPFVKASTRKLSALISKSSAMMTTIAPTKQLKFLPAAITVNDNRAFTTAQQFKNAKFMTSRTNPFLMTTRKILLGSENNLTKTTLTAEKIKPVTFVVKQQFLLKKDATLETQTAVNPTLTTRRATHGTEILKNEAGNVTNKQIVTICTPEKVVGTSSIKAQENTRPQLIPDTIKSFVDVQGVTKYYFHDHKRGQKNWTEARDFCRYIGMELVSIETKEENGFIASRLTTEISQIWIGLNDLGTEGDYRWIGNNKKADFFDWDENEPNDTSGAEDCVEFGRRPMANIWRRRWNDLPCNVTASFVCEIV